MRTLPGFADFDPSKEMLRCLKPGTGLKDAPQAFSVKLAKVTAACGLRALSVDPELEVYHDQSGTLCFIMSKHVDDLKFAGHNNIVKRVMGKIQETFGPLRIVAQIHELWGQTHPGSHNQRDHSRSD